MCNLVRLNEVSMVLYELISTLKSAFGINWRNNRTREYTFRVWSHNVNLDHGHNKSGVNNKFQLCSAHQAWPHINGRWMKRLKEDIYSVIDSIYRSQGLAKPAEIISPKGGPEELMEHVGGKCCDHYIVNNHQRLDFERLSCFHKLPEKLAHHQVDSQHAQQKPHLHYFPFLCSVVCKIKINSKRL